MEQNCVYRALVEVLPESQHGLAKKLCLDNAGSHGVYSKPIIAAIQKSGVASFEITPVRGDVSRADLLEQTRSKILSGDRVLIRYNGGVAIKFGIIPIGEPGHMEAFQRPLYSDKELSLVLCILKVVANGGEIMKIVDGK